MDYSNAIRTLTNIALSNNTYLKTFLNTASSTFDNDAGISIWTSNTDILLSDIRNFDKLILSIVDNEGTNSADIKERIDIFKSILKVDFNTDFRITDKALTIPMLQLWTTTPRRDFWYDTTKFKFDGEVEGKRICVPIDYYLFKKPILFVDADTDIVCKDTLILKTDNVGSITQVLPYIEVKL